MDTPVDIVENFHWLQAPMPHSDWRPWAALALGLLLLAAGGCFLLLRKRGSLRRGGPAPGRTALRRLKALGQTLSEEDQMAFVKEVSGIVRDYIQAQFGLRAPHRATEEFLRELHAGECPQALQAHRRALGIFLKQCDLVKFAQRRVVMEGMHRLLDDARQFVEASMPADPAAPNGKNR